MDVFKWSIPLGSKAVIGAEVSSEVQEEVRERLEGIHKHVLQYTHPDRIVDYDWIKGEIGIILAMLY